MHDVSFLAVRHHIFILGVQCLVVQGLHYCTSTMPWIAHGEGMVLPDPCSRTNRVLWEQVWKRLIVQPWSLHYIPQQTSGFFSQSTGCGLHILNIWQSLVWNTETTIKSEHFVNLFSLD